MSGKGREVCTFEGCDRWQVRSNMCNGHIKQIFAGQTLHPLRTSPDYAAWDEARTNAEAVESFWSKVDKSGDCWEWTGTKDDKGYGKIRRGDHTTSAHRISYALEHGSVPQGKHIDHMCHNPGCVNPRHLRAATNQQNQQNRSGANRNSRSGVRGVSPVGDKWLASARVNNRQVSAGTFATISEAAEAVRELRAELMPYSTRDQIGVPG